MKWTKYVPESEGFYFIKFGNKKHVVEIKNISWTGLCVKLDFAYIPLMMFIVEAWSERIEEPEEE